MDVEVTTSCYSAPPQTKRVTVPAQDPATMDSPSRQVDSTSVLAPPEIEAQRPTTSTATTSRRDEWGDTPLDSREQSHAEVSRSPKPSVDSRARTDFEAALNGVSSAIDQSSSVLTEALGILQLLIGGTNPPREKLHEADLQTPLIDVPPRAVLSSID